MKKIYCAVCALAITISAGSALALEKMDAKAKSDMTGQAGVTLTFDNLEQQIKVAGAGWYDADGISGVIASGQIASTDDGMVYASIDSTTPIVIKMNGAVAIDAGTGYTNTFTVNGSSVTNEVTGSFVALSFNSLRTTVTSLDVKLGLVDSKTLPGSFALIPNASSLGEVIISNLDINMASGKVLISAH